MPTDLERLQGTWNITALEIESQTMTAPAFTGSKIIVDGERFRTISMGAEYEGAIELDETATPKTFNLKFTAGPEAGNTSLGIYELDGDAWKICLTMHGDTRPKTFATQPNSGLALETLVRERQAAMPETASLPAETAPELEGEWSMVSCIRDGVVLGQDFVGNGKRVAKGNETSVSFGGQLFMQAEFSVDRSKRPFAIDYVHTDGRSKGMKQYGIYSLDGDGLTLLFACPGQDRPADFTTSKGDGRTLTVWKLLRGGPVS